MTYPTIREINSELQRRWPKAFGIPPVPLKLGIDRDLAAAGMMESDVARALHIWTRSRTYLSRLREGVGRIDLNGNPAGVVTAEQAAHAAKCLAERREEPKAPRRPASEPPAPPPPRATLAELRVAAQARRERSQKENAS